LRGTDLFLHKDAAPDHDQDRINSKDWISRNRIHCHGIAVKNDRGVIRNRAKNPGSVASGKRILYLLLFAPDINPTSQSENRVFHTDDDNTVSLGHTIAVGGVQTDS